MKHGLNRREMLIGGGAAGAAALGLAGCDDGTKANNPDRKTRGREAPKRKPLFEAKPGEPMFYPSEMTREMIEKDKSTAIQNLKDPIVANNSDGRLDRIERGFFKSLPRESQMDVPNADDYKRFIEMAQHDVEFREELHEFTQKIVLNRYGVLIDGKTRMPFIVQRIDQNEFRFIKKYLTLPSKYGWGNVPDSGKTPTGLHGIARIDEDLLGVDVSQTKEHAEDFLPIRVAGKMRYFTRGVRRADGDPAPAMTTRAFLLVSLKGARKSPGTTSRRGVNMHGRNRLEDLVSGTNGSSGCLGMANVDIEDIKKYIDKGTPTIRKNADGSDEFTNVEGGTPVLIFVSKGTHGAPQPLAQPQGPKSALPTPSSRAPSADSRPAFRPFDNNQSLN